MVISSEYLSHGNRKPYSNENIMAFNMVFKEQTLIERSVSIYRGKTALHRYFGDDLMAVFSLATEEIEGTRRRRRYIACNNLAPSRKADAFTSEFCNVRMLGSDL
jgi:hypothetical protein